MPDALIALLIVIVATVVLALPRGRRDVPPEQLGRVRRRQVFRAVGGAIVISLWPALTWHGVWWFGPALGLALLAAYVYALRPLPKARSVPSHGTHAQGTHPQGTYPQGIHSPGAQRVRPAARRQTTRQAP